MSRSPLVDLALLFVPLSLVSVGGGQTVVADIHRQVVIEQGWMSDGRFLDLFAISRMAPGPGALLASLIGWDVAGWAGALVATLAFFVPSGLMFYAVTRLWRRHPDALLSRAIGRGLEPISAGLVLASSCVLLASAAGGPLAWGVAAASALALAFTRLDPLVLLAAGASVFLLFG